MVTAQPVCMVKTAAGFYKEPINESVISPELARRREQDDDLDGLEFRHCGFWMTCNVRRDKHVSSNPYQRNPTACLSFLHFTHDHPPRPQVTAFVEVSVILSDVFTSFFRAHSPFLLTRCPPVKNCNNTRFTSRPRTRPSCMFPNLTRRSVSVFFYLGSITDFK
jgi:hypothetical protein